jgi:1,4-dihydroxy-2-naphthoyl-CoA hydrolase
VEWGGLTPFTTSDSAAAKAAANVVKVTEDDLQRLGELIPFAAMLGIELLAASPELVRGRLEVSPERCTAGGIIHGGALMALADNGGGICAILNLPDGAQGTATIESKTNFLRAVREGAVTATTRPLHKGRTLIVVETELSDDSGKLVAKVTQTQIYHLARS